MTTDIETADVQADEAPAPTESEDRARAQGWRPKDEFKGSEDKWVDADSFLERADKELPIARERTRKMEKELAELKATVKQFSEHHAKVQEIAYKRALDDVKKQRREALAIGDAEAVEAAEDKLEELKEVKPQPKKEVVAELAPEYHAFAEANPQIIADKKLLKYAEGALDEIMAENPDWSLARQLKAVEKEVKETFPHKFANAKRAAAPAVEGAGAVASAGKGAKTYASLPADARAACDKYVKAGLMTKEQYTKEYFGS